MRNGKASLNFDSSGTLTDIDFTSKGYKRGKTLFHSDTDLDK